MCGIVGVCSAKGAADRSWLRAGRDALAHRGPDAAGEWWSGDGSIGFGHRRLAIIDLSGSGNQPMHDEAGRITVVFNGEIYNYRELRARLASLGHAFRSQSDTEVLLAAYREWGEDCVGHLNGMFAFALYDAVSAKVFLARDRAGEKPLFYRLADGELRFASELKALFADPAFPRKADFESLDCYLAMGFVPGERCILRGVNKLPPAHAMTFDCRSGTASVRPYWRLPDLDPHADDADEAALLDELEVLLEDSVSRQMVSDVPVGILLSGGVDSSLVTALAARRGGRIRTYTVGNPGVATHDETAHARLVARHFGTEHTELPLEEAGPDLLPLLARQYDEPLADSSMIPTYLVSRLVRGHCTVALGGDGGDELFGGYYSHSRMAQLESRTAILPKPLRAVISDCAGRFLPLGAPGRELLMSLGTDMRTGVPLFSVQFDRAARERLMAGHPHWRFVAESVRARRVPRVRDAVQRVTRLDFANYMPEDILVKVDRASMLASLEMRAPLLDHRVIEFAYAKVPSRLKATPTARKILLKRLARRLMPEGFDLQRKQGFGIPLDSWLRKGPWREQVRQILLDPGCPFSPAAVRELFKGIDAGRPLQEKVFTLVFFELWRREYRVDL